MRLDCNSREFEYFPFEPKGYKLDPWWNVAAENQASDRAHRIGQTRPVSVYKLVSQGTIEEKIIELQNKKKGLTNILRVADGTGGSPKSFLTRGISSSTS